ncbi:TPA: hypothetical protein OXT20_002867 [Acinetobacter baumannii]|nr:hypothetical protein [Acinetobacter baumannii]EKU3463059.1 hypothetical protein [Acinetobacter baumannii]EKX2253795.1 hypothetical protein [Acinetobacter baumannii]EKX8031714.1 hypothetical protein [Acinetobacter baumannii]HCW6363063.1 hypothetical protein [Acinetobacter baumannii]
MSKLFWTTQLLFVNAGMKQELSVFSEFPPYADIRHATPEEIAAGHRIDNDMGDDFPIENHISPLCKSKDV